MPRIYALLVGINNYPIKPLRGCINDVNAVKAYLEKNAIEGNSIFIKTLTDEDAIKPSRQELINAFEFFSEASGEDTCLFYYSGHGSFSEAPPEFQSDNGFIQSFVCMDSRLPGGKDLMDKEMSYLIWKTMHDKPRVTFVAITDCCHSGTITRVLFDESNTTDRMVASEDGHYPSIEEYLGYHVTINGKDAYEKINSGASKILKVRQGNHIHIAASRDNQTSKELEIDGEIRGAFTHSLLKTLYINNGRISYKELVEKTSILVKNMVSDQYPDINLNGDLAITEKSKLFLSKEAVDSAYEYLVYFDPKYGWCINAGSMHGVNQGDIVTIEKVCTSVITGSPAPHFSIVMSKLELGFDKNTFHATVQRVSSRTIDLSFAGDFPGKIKQLLHEVKSDSDFSSITLLDKNTGKYILRVNGLNEVSITLPGSEVSIINPVKLNDAEAAFTFLEEITKISKWVQLLELDNYKAALTDKDYTIKLYRSEQPGNNDLKTFEEIKDASLITELYYKQVKEEWHQPAFALSITNHKTTPIWVTNAYLGFDYSITTNFFYSLEIAPENTVYLNYAHNSLSDNVVSMEIDPHYINLGYTVITEYIKLFISTDKIPTDRLQQKGIPLADTRDKNTRTRSIGTRRPSTGESLQLQSGISWKTETIGFKIIKPQTDTSITPGKETVIGNVTISAHDSLLGKIAITSSSLASKSADGIIPPYLANKNSQLTPVELLVTTRSDTTMDVIELVDIKNKAVVSAGNPLTIQVASIDKSEDVILPIGYDPETKLYYPLGYINREGNIIIETLPLETPTDAAITHKSFSSSIKIYLQKVVGQKFGLNYTYPRLAKVMVSDDLKVTYEDETSALKKAVTEANTIVLFIHGIIGDTESIVKCIKTPLDVSGNTIEKGCDLILTFDYENLNTPIEATADALKEKLAEAGLGNGHSKQLTIVAHSMGGLVSRFFIEKYNGNEVVSKLIMLGTPNNGTPWADVRDLAQTLLTYAINGAAFLKPWMFVLSGVGKLTNGVQHTLKQMDSKTGIYTLLNKGTDPKIPYVIIAGNTQKIVAHYEQKDSLVQQLFTRIKARGLYTALDAVIFRKANDIAVTSESIKTLEGSESWNHQLSSTEVASDHLSYFTKVDCVKLIFDNVEKKLTAGDTVIH